MDNTQVIDVVRQEIVNLNLLVKALIQVTWFIYLQENISPAQG